MSEVLHNLPENSQENDVATSLELDIRRPAFQQTYNAFTLEAFLDVLEKIDNRRKLNRQVSNKPRDMGVVVENLILQGKGSGSNQLVTIDIVFDGKDSFLVTMYPQAEIDEQTLKGYIDEIKENAPTSMGTGSKQVVGQA